MRITKSVRALEAYVPGEQPQAKSVVKLNTNENPYPPSPACAAVLRKFDLDRLRRYPDPVFAELRAELAKLNGTRPENIFVGNGSDEVLSVAAKTFVEDDETIGSLDPSYSLYKTLAAIRGVRWVGVEGQRSEAEGLEEGQGERSKVKGQRSKGEGQRSKVKGQTKDEKFHCLTSDLGPLTSSLPSDLGPRTSSLTSLFLWTNPNAPTGTFIEPKEIAAFAKNFKGVVIVDEAYADFARDNCMRFAVRGGNRNLMVMRTFSKSYSLAGLRVGYCVGPRDLIDAMYKVKDSYNVDAIAQAVALAAVRDQAWMRRNVARVVKTRTRTAHELVRRGWDVLPSESNFVFVKPPTAADPRSKVKGQTAESIFNALRARNIFVRYFRGPKTGDRLRVTIGTDAQMKKLLDALDKIKI